MRDTLGLGSFNHVTDQELPGDYYGTWDRLSREHRTLGVHPASSAFDLNPAAEQVTWYLLRYEDIHAAYRRPRLFSSSRGAYTNDDHPRRPIDVDPPEHAHYRLLLNAMFSPGRVKLFEADMRERCRSLLDGFVDRGECEFVSDFAYRFGPYIFMKILGLPPEEVDDFLVLAARRTWGKLSQTEEETRVAQAQCNDFLASIVSDREKQPRDDLISELVQSDLDGREIDHQGLVDIVSGLFGAGLETVASASTWMFAHLASNASDRRFVATNPDRTGDAVDELLRAYPIVVNERIVTQDVEFAGCPMKAGDRVALPTAAGNRDPLMFANPTEVDFDRETARSLVFGAGPHRCVGAHLARLELCVALEEWHARIPEYRINGRVEAHAGPVCALDALPLGWDTPSA